ncbi:MAG: KEOPS complex subunit Cgi121 [Candidatus Freyarchaeota archaeon]|nr:KEOPS complex subunit Cgi121 [Candidatus Freyrarchaeum guaymaensis]
MAGLMDKLKAGICGVRVAGVDVDGALGAARQVEESLGVAVQLFDASLVATWEHVFFSALNAVKAFNSGRGIARTIGMEFLVRMSGQRQISVALEMFGLKPGIRELGVLVVGEDESHVKSAIQRLVGCLKGVMDEGVLELNLKKAERIKKVFNVKDEELAAVGTSKKENFLFEALAKCCIERSAVMFLES